jgi:hypothetical protein
MSGQVTEPAITRQNHLTGGHLKATWTYPNMAISSHLHDKSFEKGKYVQAPLPQKRVTFNIAKAGRVFIIGMSSA